MNNVYTNHLEEEFKEEEEDCEEKRKNNIISQLVMNCSTNMQLKENSVLIIDNSNFDEEIKDQ